MFYFIDALYFNGSIMLLFKLLQFFPQPLFKNAELGIKDLSSHMRSVCLKDKLLRENETRKQLIGSYFVEKTIINTDLLKVYYWINTASYTL